MSSYAEYEDTLVRRRRSERDRDRRPRRGDREYVEEEYVRRGAPGNGPRQMSLVQRRRDDSVDSIEEVERDFPPGSGGYVRRSTVRDSGRRTRSAGRDRYIDDDDRRSRGSEYYERKSRKYDDRREYRLLG
jgi:hypothetical protein